MIYFSFYLYLEKCIYTLSADQGKNLKLIECLKWHEIDFDEYLTFELNNCKFN